MNNWAMIPGLLIPLTLYGFVLWLLFKIATSLMSISRSMEEVTQLLRQNLADRQWWARPISRPDEPAQ
jgi:hypothetical protein